jgi:transposase
MLYLFMQNKQEKSEDLYRESLLKIAFLSSQNDSLNSTVAEQQNELLYLREQLAWFRKQMFGQKSEKLKDLPIDEPLLPGLDLGEEVIEEEKEEPEKKNKEKTRSRTKNKGKFTLKLPDNLEVKETIHELLEDERIDPVTGEELVEIGREVVEKLACNPAKYYLDRQIYVKYAVKNSSPARMIQLPAPDSILRGSKFDESFMAEVVTAKLAYHLPFYRQQEMLECLGIGIERQTLSSLFVNLGDKMEPLYDEMKKAALEYGYLFTDDTSAKMLQPGKGKTKKVYMWVYEVANPNAPPYRLYEFSVNRSHDHPIEFLKDFRGIIHADAFGAYVKLDKEQDIPIKWASCWIHARRYFLEAQAGDRELKKFILKSIRNLYRYEKVAWKRDAATRLEIRNKYERPIVDEIFKRLWHKAKTEQLVPKMKQTDAIKYMLNHEKNFKYYLDDANICIDNNAAERAMRKIVLGRKNWMFVGSPRAGKSMAILYSFVQTCRALKIDPQSYLEDIFRRLQGHPHKNLRELLPDQWNARRTKSD